ncbi:preprotein translocase subunit Sec61beta [Candidatus Woesearchaeota archaeon]|nr:preprotein translocase subunit Sec61beta [Candidatus Woesearchaeota archaeon]
MARDNKIRMPSSGAGITTYYDGKRSAIQLKPAHVVLLIVIVILIEFFLYWQGYALFGL